MSPKKFKPENDSNFQERREQANDLVDRLLPVYDIPPTTEESRGPELHDDSVLRRHVEELLNQERQGVSDDELFDLKRALIVDSLARTQIGINSGWINLINDIVVTNAQVPIDDALIMEAAELRERVERSKQAFQAHISFLSNLGYFDGAERGELKSTEDVDAFLAGLSAEQRAELDRLQKEEREVYSQEKSPASW